MKKKILSLLVTGCLLFVPTTAFADDNKTVIKTVDDLLAFSKAVNNGDYDKNKDAVVVLENDLDLTGVVWTPIGNVFDENGYIEHCFSGKFYGNGHTISNIDFTSIYGKDSLSVFVTSRFPSIVRPDTSASSISPKKPTNKSLP